MTKDKIIEILREALEYYAFAGDTKSVRKNGQLAYDALKKCGFGMVEIEPLPTTINQELFTSFKAIEATFYNK